MNDTPTRFETLYPREARFLMRMFTSGQEFKWNFLIE